MAKEKAPDLVPPMSAECPLVDEVEKRYQEAVMAAFRSGDIDVLVGLPSTTGSLPIEVEKRGAPALVSANSLWDNKRKRFRDVGEASTGLNLALDSAGFVATRQYGGAVAGPAVTLQSPAVRAAVTR